MLLKPYLAAEAAVETAAEAAAESGFAFHPEMFVENLKYMGLGMLCIFIVIAVIIGIVMLLEKLTSRKKSDDAE
ncbi:MAG: hypothetical protein IJ037_04750 [Clostridia bacterium]|nr:hypothetical protein [Clostridia bacterium]MBQ8370937.1 hypothetical protein [Clostridia bacterium]MBQ8513740.1 hypothetical protein [Clostridia bacterium]